MRNLMLLAFAVLTACASGRSGGASWSAGVSPAVAGEENEIDVHDATRSDRTMLVTLRMTDMEMPPLRIVLTRGKDGTYRAHHVQFAMSGAWELDAHGHRVSVAIR